MLALLTCLGCAETPDITQSRAQIDDLRDDDMDGVINQRDLCQQSPSNTLVDNQGCTEWETNLHTEVLSVYFDMAKHELRDDQRPTLTQIFEYLTEHKDAYVILVGDTSVEGAEDYNHQLAFRRTGAIREQLVSRGIAPERISEQEYFQITSITEQLQARERRTIAVITHPQSDVEPAWDIFTSERVIEGEAR
jgi:outer membrane protein OmpA-like peptidoglycan-associated protein